MTPSETKCQLQINLDRVNDTIERLQNFVPDDYDGTWSGILDTLGNVKIKIMEQLAVQSLVS